MPLLVVIAVALVVFLYVRMTRRARREWLQRLDLPGRWHADAGNEDANVIAELTLSGGLDDGSYVLRQGDTTTRGAWRLAGHTLSLRGDGGEQVFDLHFFKAGHIGLEDTTGARHLLYKAADNVVALRDRSGSS